MAADPLFASVALLALNENGADGSTTFDDASNANRTLTGVGNAQWDTAQAPPGMVSSYLGDGNGDRVTAADADALDMQSAFCIECWFRAANTTGQKAILSKWNSGAVPGSSFSLDLSGTTLTWFVPRQSDGFWDGGNGPAGDPKVDTLTATIAADTWYHVALDWDGSAYRGWLDGVSMGSEARTTGMFNSTEVFSIGGYRSFATFAWNGWIGPVRVTNASRYTSAFTPPTLPFPTTEEEAAEEEAAAVTPAGGLSRHQRRRRFLFPDGTSVICTMAEAQQLLEQFTVIKREDATPKQRKQATKRAKVIRAPRAELEAVQWKPAGDSLDDGLLMPILPNRIFFEPDPQLLAIAVGALKRKIDDEEALIALMA